MTAMKMRRWSRPCYDKFHRCPGWAGGGMHYAKKSRCNSGRIAVDYENRWWKWRLWPCDTCNVVVIPYALTKLAPSNVGFAIGWWWRNR